MHSVLDGVLGIFNVVCYLALTILRRPVMMIKACILWLDRNLSPAFCLPSKLCTSAALLWFFMFNHLGFVPRGYSDIQELQSIETASRVLERCAGGRNSSAVLRVVGFRLYYLSQNAAWFPASCYVQANILGHS